MEVLKRRGDSQTSLQCGRVLMIMSQVCAETRDFEPAQEFCRQALAQYRKHHGGKDANDECIFAHSMLANFSSELGKFSEATDLLRKLLNLQEAMNPSEGLPLLGMCETHMRIAGSYACLEDVEQALEHYRIARDIATRAHGSEHNADSAQCLHFMGRLLLVVDQNARASAIQDMALLSFAKVFGPDSDAAVPTLLDRSITRVALHDMVGAKSDVDHASRLVADHPDDSDLRVQVAKMQERFAGISLTSDVPATTPWLLVAALGLAGMALAGVVLLRTRAT
jgi:tetratricopeptide (TPR) repeat protein